MPPFPSSPSIPLAATVEPWLPEGSGWIGTWTPGIGDPGFMGWFTVVAYFLAALACWRLRRLVKRVDVVDGDRELRFWTWMGGLLCFLCVNKQLDLQSAMTEFLRQTFKHLDLYQVRRRFQVAFIWVMALSVPVLGWLLYRFGKDFARSIKLAGMGLILLLVFILIRASSFHNVDAFLGKQLAEFRVNWILELGGIAVVLWGAGRRRRELRRIHMAQSRS